MNNPGNKQARSVQFFIAAALCLLSISLSGCDNQPKVTLPLLFDGDVILAFGDSLTYGTGARRSESYPSVLSHLAKLEVINEGVPGDTTADGLKRLETALKEHKPALVLLCLGGNDFLRKRQESETIKNLETILALIRSRGISVALISVPKLGFSLSPHPLFERIAEKNKVALISGVMSEILADKSLKSDPIHPNAQGYRTMAEKIYVRLDELGAF